MHAAARTLPMAPPVTGAVATDMPPFALPGWHFAIALAWLVAGSAGLFWAAPLLATGQWLTPVTAAVTHTFTLGWLLTSAYGVLYQVGPVALGVHARNWRAGFVTLALHTTGAVLLIVGMARWIPALSGLGWFLVVAALALWSWNAGARLLHAPRATRQGRIVGLAFAFLWIAVLVAGARLGNAMGWWMVPREPLVAAHVQLALGGFATLLVMGVGSHILPMFLLARDAPDWPGRSAVPLVALGAGLQAAGWLVAEPITVKAGGVALASGVLLFLWQARLWFRHRARRDLDTALRQVMAAMAALVLAIIAGLAALMSPSPRLIAIYGALAIVGWLGLLIGAIYGRVLPFLTWMDRYRDRAGQRGIPKPGDMVHGRTMQRITVLWTAGVALLVLAIAVNQPTLARIASLLYLVATVATALTYSRLVRFHHRD